MLLEVLFHIHSFTITRPSRPLDAPFHTGFQDPVANMTARKNAVLLMLARNSEVSGAVDSVRSVQKQFNDHFGYPWIFLNDKPWSEEFKEKVSEAVQNTSAAGHVSVEFNTIPKDMWRVPFVDRPRPCKTQHEGHGGRQNSICRPRRIPPHVSLSIRVRTLFNPPSQQPSTPQNPSF
ncbi:glycosyltransferase family 15 protein [Bipolaris zeicola 26-R-13]|uniref:Glycosyltransferase family 15 protein n=1 Tax=Cochliobolus carbonum (strain 26-R-13) TaxID=930089 RepID=W6XR48_COCC2|nr:glycosyltransferase family 15 protein [Bipolaris zeicola 26-R-13]EUC27790.1 glycosyltransferase family 15 protein [Bipolaris zeicola 26-R-13]